MVKAQEKLLRGSVKWSRHRKDGAPRKLCGSVARWSRHRKDGVARELCGSVRWSTHRKDGVPRKLVASMGTGKMVCLGTYCGSVTWPSGNHVVQSNLWLRKVV